MSSPLFAMPRNWDDAAGWETYHAGLYPAGPYRQARDWLEQTAAMIAQHLAALMTELRQRGQRAVWFPGCGLDPLPKLFSEFGFDVVATDVAPTAVRFQQSADNDVSGLLGRYQNALPAADAPGSFACNVHDFHTACPAGPFDLIFNSKSFQAFPDASMRQVAAVHCNALKPGCLAYFETMNVQDEHRDTLEQALVDAGFYVPLFESNRRLRQALRATGIPHLFILGRPMVPRKGVYADDEARAQRDTDTLNAIFNEWAAQREAAYKEEAQLRTPEARTAVVIYNTG
jgi:hypothetical protein